MRVKKKYLNLYLDLDSKSSWSKKTRYILNGLCYISTVDKSILAIGLTFMMFEGVTGFKLLHVSDIKSFKNM